MRIAALLLLGLSACSVAAEPDGHERSAGALSGGDAAPLDPTYFDANLADDSFFTRANPDPSRVNLQTLQTILTDAASSGSSSVVITQDDVVITEKYFGRGPHADSVQSVTKSVVSLAVGALIDEGKIASINVPVSTYYPEWGTGTKAGVTLEHLLTMTAGLNDDPNFLNEADQLTFARAQPLVNPVGAAYNYSNEDVMLFAGIVAAAAGMPLDQYVNAKYFVPLGITDATWYTDDAGNVAAPGGLVLSPLDLARLGALVRHGGQWSGASLISADWLGASTKNETPLQVCYGYLWWIVREGCDGYHFNTGVSGSTVEGAFADGWGGQFMAVIPAADLVAIRTKDPSTVNVSDDFPTGDFGFTQEAASLAVLPIAPYPFVSGSAPATVAPSATYDVTCNWGADISCGSATNSAGACTFVAFSSNGSHDATFSCVAPPSGTATNTCSTWVWSGDPKCNAVTSNPVNGSLVSGQ